ncbi:hypothetical protein [Novosphingobium sp. 11B]
MSNSDDCHIYRFAHPDGGRPKYWCLSHNSSATARFGGKLDRCEGAYRTISEIRRFALDPSSYPGGVALWGAVEPVYDSTGAAVDMGVHVHARRAPGGKKEIDRNYDAVEVVVRKDLLSEEAVLITKETAIAFYISRFLKRKIEHLFCDKCGEPHLDSDWFAVKPHKRHLCHSCNQIFVRDDRSVSNPLSAVQFKFGNPVERRPRRAKKSISIAQSDYPGGLQIWASNPALLWTSRLFEEEGIHVHGWKGRLKGKPDLDDTFDLVEIDGLRLDEDQLRHYMAQNTLAYLRNKVQSVRCPACHRAQFDRGDAAFRPRNVRTCDCGQTFRAEGRRKLLVSNPFVDTISELKKLHRSKRAE